MKREIERFKKWLIEDCDLSSNTADSYSTAISLYFYENKGEITKEKFKNQIELKIKSGRMSVKTGNLRINAFNKFMKYKGVDSSIKTAKVERRMSLENVPTENQYNELIYFLRKKENLDYYYYIRVLACTGARISELIQFSWEDLQNGIFTIRGKGNKYRNFYIPKSLSIELSDYAKKNGKRGVFLKNRFSERMTARGFSYLLRDWGYFLGFPRGVLHPHAFRHFFAKQYLKNSKNDIVQLAEFLGHANLETTRVYLLKSIEEQRADFNKYVNW